MRLDERRGAPLLPDSAAHAAGDAVVVADASGQVRPSDLESAARGPGPLREGDQAAGSPDRRRRPEHAAAGIREPAPWPAHRRVRERRAARTLSGAVRQAGPDRVPRADDQRAPLRGPGRHGRHRRRRVHDQLLPREPGQLLDGLSLGRAAAARAVRFARPVIEGPARQARLLHPGLDLDRRTREVPQRHPLPGRPAHGLPRRPPARRGRCDHERRRDPPRLPGTGSVHEVDRPRDRARALRHGDQQGPPRPRALGQRRARPDALRRHLAAPVPEVAPGDAAPATGPVPRLMAELKDIDRALADLRTGADRLGQLLLELELDGDRKLLDDVKLEGATANRWSAVAGDLLAAWESHARVTATLERADELRGSRPRLGAQRLAELEELLDGQSELLRSALRDAKEASAIVRDAGAAWGTLTPRIAAAGGAVHAGGLDGLRGTCERLSAELAADPLSVDSTQVDALE